MMAIYLPTAKYIEYWIKLKNSSYKNMHWRPQYVKNKSDLEEPEVVCVEQWAGVQFNRRLISGYCQLLVKQSNLHQGWVLIGYNEW